MGTIPSNPSPDAIGGMAIFGPPTSLTDLVIWMIEKVVEDLPIWGKIWNAIAFNYKMSNPPAVVNFQNLIWYFYPSQPNPLGSPANCQTFNGTTWSQETSFSNAGTTVSGGPGAAVYENAIYVFWQYGHNTGQLWYTMYSNALGGWTWYPWLPLQSGAIMSNGPSAVAFNGSLYVFYQGPGLDGQLYFSQATGSPLTKSTTDNFCPTSIQVPNTGMSASPSAVAFTNSSGQELYVFHQGGGNNGQLWYNIMNTSGDWQGDTQITSVSMQDAPVAVAYNNSIYVLYNGGNSELFYIVSTDGIHWSTPLQVAQLASSSAPSAVVYNNAPHLVVNSNGTLWYAPVNPGSQPGIMTPVPGNIPVFMSPACLVVGIGSPAWPLAGDTQRVNPTSANAVVCFTNNNGALSVNSYNSETGWSPGSSPMTAADCMSQSPAPIIYNNVLYIFYQGGPAPGKGDGALCYLTFSNGVLSSQITVSNVGMSGSPSPVVFNGELYVFHQGYNDTDQIWYSVFNSSTQTWAPDTQVPASAIPNYWGGSGNTANPPTAIVYNGTIYLFYLVNVASGQFNICYNSFDSSSWGGQMGVTSGYSPSATGPVALMAYDDGNGEQLYCIYPSSGSIYYLSFSNPSLPDWSPPAQLGTVLPGETPPVGTGAALANTTVAAIQFIAGS